MIVLIVSVLAALMVASILIKPIMKFFYITGITSLDIHKRSKPILPASGGMCCGWCPVWVVGLYGDTDFYLW